MEVASDAELLRAAHNQSLYRQVNEQILGLLSVDTRWVCECADQSCTQPMDLTLAEYEALRKHPNQFAVLPGHVYAEVERVVGGNERYVVVEKLGAGAAFAVEHDPRRQPA